MQALSPPMALSSTLSVDDAQISGAVPNTHAGILYTHAGIIWESPPGASAASPMAMCSTLSVEDTQLSVALLHTHAQGCSGYSSRCKRCHRQWPRVPHTLCGRSSASAGCKCVFYFFQRMTLQVLAAVLPCNFSYQRQHVCQKKWKGTKHGILHWDSTDGIMFTIKMSTTNHRSWQARTWCC